MVFTDLKDLTIEMCSKNFETVLLPPKTIAQIQINESLDDAPISTLRFNDEYLFMETLPIIGGEEIIIKFTDALGTKIQYNFIINKITDITNLEKLTNSGKKAFTLELIQKEYYLLAMDNYIQNFANIHLLSTKKLFKKIINKEILTNIYTNIPLIENLCIPIGWSKLKTINYLLGTIPLSQDSNIRFYWDNRVQQFKLYGTRYLYGAKEKEDQNTFIVSHTNADIYNNISNYTFGYNYSELEYKNNFVYGTNFYSVNNGNINVVKKNIEDNENIKTLPIRKGNLNEYNNLCIKKNYLNKENFNTVFNNVSSKMMDELFILSAELNYKVNNYIGEVLYIQKPFYNEEDKLISGRYLITDTNLTIKCGKRIQVTQNVTTSKNQYLPFSNDPDDHKMFVKKD